LRFDIAIPMPKGILFVMYIRHNTEIAGAPADNAQKASQFNTPMIVLGVLERT
jgi:hypothetical protein